MALFSTLTDNFNDNSLNETKWQYYIDSNCYFAEVNSEWELTSALAGGYILPYSQTTYDLTGSQVTIEVVDAGNQSLASWYLKPIELADDVAFNTNIILWKIAGNVITAEDGTNGINYTETYDSNIFKYLRIRESEGLIYWDYSPNGTSWTNAVSVANPSSVTAKYVAVEGYSSTESSTTIGKVDNFNILPTNPTQTVTAPYNLIFGEKYDPILLNAIIGNIIVSGISGFHILSETITGSNIASGTVTGDRISAATISGQNIMADAIGASHIASNTISADDIQTDAITSTKILAGSITADKILAGAVTASKISVSSLDAISASLGEVTSGLVTAATVRTSASPSVSRVIMDGSGLRGYDSTLGATFKLPTDGSSPVFANGIIQSATIIDTTIISNTFQSSSELPWVEISDSGLAYRESVPGAVYGDGTLYGDGTKYGVGVSCYFGNSAKPVLSVEAERSIADIRLYNRSSEPSGAAVIGDLAVVSGTLRLCTTAGTPGTYKTMATTGLTGTKVYYVSDSSGGTVDRKLTFTNGILTAET